MDTIYLVTWSGGWEMPDHFATTDRATAETCFEDWTRQAEEDMDFDGTVIELLAIQTNDQGGVRAAIEKRHINESDEKVSLF